MKKISIFLFLLVSLIVLSSCEKKVEDKIAPLLRLNADNQYVVIKENEDTNLQEKLLEGITALDNVDGDITKDVVIIDDELDIKTPGEYTVGFIVYDKSGNQSQIVRKTVIVQKIYSIINHYPVWNDVIVNEKAPEPLKEFKGAWYHKVVSSVDAWVGIEGIVTLPEMNLRRYGSSYNSNLPADPNVRALDNPSVYMGGHSSSESDVGLSYSTALINKNGTMQMSAGSYAFRPFWRYITTTNKDEGGYDLRKGRRYSVVATGSNKTNMFGNWHFEDTEFYYLPGDKVRMMITSPKPHYLQLQIEVLEVSKLPYSVNIRKENNWREPKDFISPEFRATGHGVDNPTAEFKRVNAIDQVGNEGKDTIYTDTEIKEAVWESTYLHRRINGVLYKVPMNENRVSQMSSTDSTGYIVTKIDSKGGQSIIISPGKAVTKPKE